MINLKLKFTYPIVLSVLILGCTQSKAPDYSDITIYSAESIITVNDKRPKAEAIAIDYAGRITGLGKLEVLQSKFNGAKTDSQFQNKIIVPGLIDPHVHMTLGSMMYGLDFIPPWDMETPKGTVKGLPDKTALLDKIAEFEKNAPDGPLFLYGYHNLVQGDLTRQDLDKISSSLSLIHI